MKMKVLDKRLHRDNLLIYKNKPAIIFSLILMVPGLILFILMATHDEWILDTKIVPQLLLILMFAVNIMIAVWVKKISKIKNQFDVSFLFLSLLLGPIFLLIIGNLDYCFKNPAIKRIIYHYRQEFNERSAGTSSDKSELAKEYLNKIETRLLVERIAEYEKLSTISAATRIPQLNKYILRKIDSIDILTYGSSKPELQEWNSTWSENENVCPACGTKLSETDKFCTGCGLKISD